MHTILESLAFAVRYILLPYTRASSVPLGSHCLSPVTPLKPPVYLLSLYFHGMNTSCRVKEPTSLLGLAVLLRLHCISMHVLASQAPPLLLCALPLCARACCDPFPILYLLSVLWVSGMLLLMIKAAENTSKQGHKFLLSIRA